MISLKDKEVISKLIKEAESKTHSELIPMIVQRSDDYPAAHFRCAIVVSFIFSLILYFSPLTIINPIYFLWIQLPGLLVGYYLANIDFIGRLFVTDSEKKTEVRQRAIEAFYDRNLHFTDRHNGVLLFISLFEKKIEIITDVSVREVIKKEEWNEIILAFKKIAKDSDYIEALKKTIPKATDILEIHFPHTGEKTKNEIRNELIIE